MILVNSARLSGAAVGCVLWVMVGHAHAAPLEAPTPAPIGFEMTEIEVGVGWWAMPTGEVCTQVQCVRGDSSLLFSLAGLVHSSANWAWGAGAHFALLPTTVPEPLDAEAPTSRQLARSWLWLEAEARWFPWRNGGERSRPLQAWFGLNAGLVLLSDRYFSPLVDDQGPLRIGDRGLTLSTPGLSLRPGLGLDWDVARHWAVGASLRPGLMWFPGERTGTPFGDQATVSGLQWTAAALISVKLRFPW